MRGHYGSHFLSRSLGCQVSRVTSVEGLGLGCVSRDTRISYRMFAAAMCYGSWRLLCVRLGMFAVAPAHQLFSSNSLDLSAPVEAYRRNVCVSGTLKIGYEGVFKITTHVPRGFDSQIHILIMDVCCGHCGCKLGMQDWLQSHWKWNFPVLGEGTETCNHRSYEGLYRVNPLNGTTLICLIILAGDTETNPGPRFQCGLYKKFLLLSCFIRPFDTF